MKTGLATGWSTILLLAYPSFLGNWHELMEIAKNASSKNDLGYQ
jgi:hypothetical protein